MDPSLLHGHVECQIVEVNIIRKWVWILESLQSKLKAPPLQLFISLFLPNYPSLT